MLKQNRAGFTLVELVIVLGISGLIFAGLWGLMTSGSSQLQAQSAAQQYRQVIAALRKYLANPPGSAAGGCAAFTAPGVGAPTQITPNCLVQHGFLSANFATVSGTTYSDAFGHTIRAVFEQLDASATKFRFMVYSTGTPLINDKAGSMVSSLIGSEGGFIYSAATEGCSTTATATNIACGSFGSFAFNVVTNSYTSPHPGSGHIATLSYTDDNAYLDSPWLARVNTLGEAFNTMSTDLYMGGQNIDMSSSAATTGGANILMDGGNIAMASATTATTGGGRLAMSGGHICLGATSGTTCGATSGGVLYMGNSDIRDLDDVFGISTSMTFTSLSMTATSAFSLTSSTGMTFTPGSACGATGCTINVNGNPLHILLTVNGIAKADELQAGTFIYSASDASMKTNLKVIESALDKILALRGYLFDWKGSGKRDIGVIAQEVEKVFPEAVTKMEEGKLGVDYAKMVAPLIEAVRELKAQNDNLKKEIEAIKAVQKK